MDWPKEIRAESKYGVGVAKQVRGKWRFWGLPSIVFDLKLLVVDKKYTDWMRIRF